MKQLTTTLPLLLVAALLATGCGVSKEELDKLKVQAKSAEARLAVAKKEPQHAFQAGLGDLRYIVTLPGNSVALKPPIVATIFEIGNATFDSKSCFQDLNKELQKTLYAEGDTTKEQGATGALAAFFYPLTDEFMGIDMAAAPTDSQRYLSLTRIILQCKEALAALVEQPANYASDKVDQILAEHQQKMTQAPELAIDTSGRAPVLREKSGSTPQDYYQAPKVKEAYEAFKKEVKKLQKNYEIVLGLQPPEQS